MTPTPEWLNSVLSLLSSSSSECLACGKQGKPSSLSPALCVKCAALIPWIKSPRCPKCGRHVGCPDCSRGGESSPIVCNRSAVAYNSVMREWLGQYKYRGNETFAPLLGFMLEKAYQMLKIQHEEAMYQNGSLRPVSAFPFRRSPAIVPWKADLLVPVPVSEPRLVERGFNQAERLAAELSCRIGIPVLPLLVRTHHTDKQSFKGRAERLTNMKHAFGPDPLIIEDYFIWLRGITDTLALPKGSMDYTLHDTKHTRSVRIIIVDDIYTTGSTIRACAESVRQMTEACRFKSDIYSLTWARS